MTASTIQNISIKGLATALPDNPNRISLNEQTASDLAFEAALKVLSESGVDKEEIGVLIFLSTTPDYRSPATAMVLQNRLSVNPDCIAFDINSGGNGFLHGLEVGASLLKSTSKDLALVLFGDTPSKQFIEREDNSLNYIDAGSAVLLGKSAGEEIWKFSNYTQSEHFEKYILKKGGYREAFSQGDDEPYSGLSELKPLIIDEVAIPQIQMKMITEIIKNYLSLIGNDLQAYDYIFFDHYNLSVFSSIIAELDINSEKTFFNNHKNQKAGGSFLPLLIQRSLSQNEKSSKKSYQVLMVSFGEGLSVSLSDLLLDPSVFSSPLETNSYYTEGSIISEI